jgi:hypothetical protein
MVRLIEMMLTTVISSIMANPVTMAGQGDVDDNPSDDNAPPQR